jgi:hypothetical protein
VPLISQCRQLSDARSSSGAGQPFAAALLRTRIGCAKLEMWLVTRRSYAYDDEIVEGGISLSVISP